MATISKLLSFIALLLMLANKLAHSQVVTSFNYDNFSSTEGLTYQGGTNVPPGSTFLRLTRVGSNENPMPLNVGRVLYSSPVNFWQNSSGIVRQASFNTRLHFVITPSRSGAADGLAFFIAPVNTTIPTSLNGGNLGVFGIGGRASNVFAVEFDTFVNSWDPPRPHMGIDIESRTSRTNRTFDSGTGQLVTARINYNANTRRITVVATSGSRTARLSYVFDLKTILHKQVQVGLSSAGGLRRSELGVTNVISWSFTSSLVYENKVYTEDDADDVDEKAYTEDDADDVDEKAYIREYIGME